MSTPRSRGRARPADLASLCPRERRSGNWGCLDEPASSCALTICHGLLWRCLAETGGSRRLTARENNQGFDRGRSCSMARLCARVFCADGHAAESPPSSHLFSRRP